MSADSTHLNAHPKNISEAIQLQKQWAPMVRARSLPKNIRMIAGADVAFPPGSNTALAAIVLMTWPDLELLESAHARLPLTFPYIPGLLSFREAPAIVAAARKLSIKPDVLLVDGQGMAHPRRFGLACHLGVQLAWPTIGCAKSRLIGSAGPLAEQKGAKTELIHHDEIIGWALRSRTAVKCLYVSIGHLVRLDQAVELVLNCCRRYRLPEPTRLADKFVRKLPTTITIDKAQKMC